MLHSINEFVFEGGYLLTLMLTGLLWPIGNKLAPPRPRQVRGGLSRLISAVGPWGWPFLLTAAPAVLMCLILTITAPFALMWWSLTTGHFWLGYAALIIIYINCAQLRDRLARSIVKTLQPWVVATTIVASLLLIVTLWFPVASWPWLFRMEEAVSWIDRVLRAVMPSSLPAKLAVVIGLLVANLALPHWRVWTGRAEKVRAALAKGAPTIAILAGLTFFGHPRAVQFAAEISAEKQQRIEAQTIAVAQLMIAARIAAEPDTEAQAAAAWLDAVVAGVKLQMDEESIETAIQEELEEARQRRTGAKLPANVPANRASERIRATIEQRVAELRNAIAAQPMIQRSTTTGKVRTFAWFHRRMTPEDIAEARRRFERAMDHVVSASAKFAGRPLDALTEAVGMPKLAQELVTDFYRSEVERLAKVVTEPLSDALFRPGSPQAATTAERLAAVQRLAPLNVGDLPREIARPTSSDLRNDRIHETLVKEAVAKAARR